MILRFIPKPSILCFITTKTNRSLLRLRSNLLPAEGKSRSTFGVHLNVRSMSASASSSSPVLSEKQVVDNVFLSGKEDEHGGVIVEMSKEPIDPIIFSSLLKASMLHWKQQANTNALQPN